jgi:hypothetical protein
MAAYEMKPSVGRPLAAEIHLEKAVAWKRFSEKTKTRLQVSVSVWRLSYLPS